MIYNNLSATEKRRFKRNNICPICREVIDENSEFEYLTFKQGKFTRYRFFHIYCMTKNCSS